MAPRAPDPVTLPAGLDRRVEAAARDRFGPCSVTRMDVMPGGHSGATHLVELDVGGVTRPIVVKSTPPGRRPVGRHDVLRQARVLDAVRRWGALPIPAVLFADVQPPPFYGMEHVAGRATEPILDEPSPDESERRVAEAWDAAIGLLARLHSAPIAELDLGEEVIRTPLGELERWRSTMRAAQMSDSPAAERLCQALANAAPDEGRAALLHGDYRLGNLVMVGAKPRGLLDWEIWSLGDPAVDLGWFAQFSDPGNFPGAGRTAPGTPSPEAVIDRYLELTGERDPKSIQWFVALGCFKLAAIVAHNRRRHREGRHPDAFQERLGPAVNRLLERGLEHLART